MAKERVTISVDRSKLSAACTLLEVSSASAAIDLALSETIRCHQVINDVLAYSDISLTSDEIILGMISNEWHDLEDEIDWDAEWPVEK